MPLSEVIIILGTLTFCSACQAQKSPAPAADQLASKSVGEAVEELAGGLMHVYQARNGEYWFGSNGQGVYRYDGRRITRYRVEDGLCDNNIVGIQEDDAGRLYFDTMKGISQYDGREFKTLSLTDDDSTHDDWKLNRSDLWFRGSWKENGPYRYDGESLQHLKFPRHPLDQTTKEKLRNVTYSPYGINIIHTDARGNVWFGTSNLGVCRYDGKTHAWIFEDELTELDDGPAPGVRSIMVDSEGYYWFSNDLHHRYKVHQQGAANESDRVVYERIDSMAESMRQKLPRYCMSIAEDNNGDKWFATYDSGVWRYDGENLTHYPVTIGGKSVTLFSIYKDREGFLWLGTHGSGALKFNGESFERFAPVVEKE
jgi:ligand-binding sensor domain-containing protein